MSSKVVARQCAADYSTKVGYWVYESDADEVTLADDATAEVPFGIIISTTDDGLYANIAVDGYVFPDAVLGADIAIATGGTRVTNDALGKTKAAAGGDFVGGWLDMRSDVTTAGNTNGVRVRIAPNPVVLA